MDDIVGLLDLDDDIVGGYDEFLDKLSDLGTGVEYDDSDHETDVAIPEIVDEEEEKKTQIISNIIDKAGGALIDDYGFMVGSDEESGEFVDGGAFEPDLEGTNTMSALIDDQGFMVGGAETETLTVDTYCSGDFTDVLRNYEF